MSRNTWFRELQVQNEYFTAKSVWYKTPFQWSCHQADPIVSWMKSKSPNQVHIELIRLGCDYQWSKPFHLV